jgi:CBS domain containing-hemolysin-like protein
MFIYIVGIVLILIGLGALALQRLYSSVPVRELKRLAARGDSLAQRMYRPAGYGPNLRLLLWIILGLSWSGGLVLLLGALQPLSGFALSLALSVIAFVWLPTLRLTQTNAHAAVWLAGPLAWLLAHAHPLLSRVTSLVYRHREPAVKHSRLYEQEDLLELLERQPEQIGNRISEQVLQLAARAITFTDRQAGTIARPLKDAVLVNADDSLGPVLLDQLHQARQSTFLVYKDERDNIIGSLALSDAVRARQGGRVFDLVRGGLAFVHEDFNLQEVLSAFQKTNQRVVVVINDFEESLGVITLDELLSELLGPATGQTDNNDMVYEDRKVVAAYKPMQADKTTETPEIEEQPLEPALEEAQD